MPTPRASVRDGSARAAVVLYSGASLTRARGRGVFSECLLLERRPSSAMTLLTLYSKPDCHLCVEARNVLLRVQADLDFELSERDITTDEALHRAYFERIPVVALGDEELFEYFVHEDALRQHLQAIL